MLVFYKMDGWHWVKTDNSGIALQSHLLADVCNETTIDHVQYLPENSEINVDDKNELNINHMMKLELDLAANSLIRGDIGILSDTTNSKLIDS